MKFVVPTYHPAFVGRNNRRLQGVALHDLERLVKLSKGWRPKWNDDNFILKPSADTVVRVLRSMHGKRVAADFETDGDHPLICQARCLAFFDGDRAICVPFLYRDGEKREVRIPGKKKAKFVSVWKPFYSGAELQKVLNAIQELLSSPATRFYYQNGQYDRVVGKYGRIGDRVLGLHFPQGFDCILSHHIMCPYYPHGLGFLGSLYTDIEHYKTNDDGESWASESDIELYSYCCRDVKVTWITAETMQDEISHLPQWPAILAHDTQHEAHCQRWKEVGLEIDLEALDLLSTIYKERAAKAMIKMREALTKLIGEDTKHEAFDELLSILRERVDDTEVDIEGKMVETFNPGSLIQLRKLLMTIGVPLTHQTDTGAISTAREFLDEARKELVDKGVPAEDLRIAFLDYLFAWREATKTETTFLRPEFLWHGPNGEISKTYVEGFKPRVHPTFNVHVVPSGRLSSQKPNFQNQPAEIRGMFVPREDHSLVAGDWDSLEMRLGALMSGDKTFIEEFKAYDAKTGPKIHILNMAAIFNLQATQEVADKHPGCYRAAKVFAYGIAYGAGEKTAFDQVRKEMPDLDFKTFQLCYARYKKKRARLFEFQTEVVAFATQNGYLDSSILKRRIFFFERNFGEHSPEASIMQNFPYQAGGSDIVSLANFRLDRECVVPTRAKLPKGQVIEQLAQIHDELLYEVPDELAEWFKGEFKRICERPPGPQWAHWNLPVDISVKKRWKPIKLPCPTCQKMTAVEVSERTATDTLWTGTCEKGHNVVRSVTRRNLENETSESVEAVTGQTVASHHAEPKRPRSTHLRVGSKKRLLGSTSPKRHKDAAGRKAGSRTQRGKRGARRASRTTPT